jgi:methylenetetrahydrofolate dehydrogenase (NADP+)/methenyltetrahydrofolate cyclohydrolase
MAARTLDGPAVAAAIRAAVMPEVARFTGAARRPPGLGIILVGDDPGSEIYVRNKIRAGGESGLQVDLFRLAATASVDDLLHLVARLNASDAHDGILVRRRFPPRWGAAPRSASSTPSIRRRT